MADDRLKDYVTVADRIIEFRTKHPAGSLRGDWRMEQVGDQALIAYRAEAFRSPDDLAPGVGCAWELVPGRTNFTRGSELQNAETSAWGRALIAVGAADAKKGIASLEEVRNRQAERADGLPANADGSLSRSRTSDAEKDAAGVMTSGQLAEHTALRRGAVTGKVAGVRRETETLPSDEFYFPAPHETVNVERAGHVVPQRAQVQKMFSRYKDLGITDDDVMRGDIGTILGREVASRGGLSAEEVGRVNSVLLDRLAEKQGVDQRV